MAKASCSFTLEQVPSQKGILLRYFCCRMSIRFPYTWTAVWSRRDPCLVHIDESHHAGLVRQGHKLYHVLEARVPG
jgi:hypothetical protein